MTRKGSGICRADRQGGYHLVEDLIDNGFVPVLSPVGVDEESHTYNVNADYAASAVAGGP